jgi:hypothetical protein
MSYDLPSDVRSPRANWQLVEVVSDGGPGGPSYALGTWDGERRIGFRWNGTPDRPRGNPQSRGLATWTMLDTGLHAAAASTFPAEKQAFARSFLGLPEPAELRVDFHPSGRRTLKSRNGRGVFADLGGDLFGNDDAASFYRAVAGELARRASQSEPFDYVDPADS